MKKTESNGINKFLFNLWYLFRFSTVILYFVCAYLYLFEFAKELKIDSIKAQISILINISAIIFGVVGAWLALIYPTALKKMQGLGEIELAYTGVDLNILKSLVSVVFFSTLTLILSMLLDLTLTFSNHPAIHSVITSKHLKAYCAIFIWFLYIIQIFAVSSIFKSTFSLVYDLFISNTYKKLEDLLARQKT